MSNYKKVKDHLGNEYRSLKEMCEKYKINITTFRNRIKYDYTLELALTEKVNKEMKGKECKDHLGNKFSSIAKMCEYYNINRQTYNARIRLGYDIKRVLTEDVNNNKRNKKKESIDHLGNKYTSEADMCRHYKIGTTLYRSRVNRGWSIEDALTKEIDSHKSGDNCIDHLGNKFNSVYSMCRVYKIKRATFDARIKNGCSLEKALTEPVRPKK